MMKQELIGKRIQVSTSAPYCVGYTGTVIEVDAPDGSIIVKGDGNYPYRFQINEKYLVILT